MNKPPEIEISFCPEHGPFVGDHWDGPGCPIQVDYDGITCGFIDDDPTTYFRENNL